MNQVFFLAVLAMLAAGGWAGSSESYKQPAPEYYKAPAYGAPYKKPYQEVYPAPAKYEYKYAVNDYYGNKQSKHEEKDGYVTKGEYTVLLPDGRLQRTRYIADEYGYRADVTYEKGYGAYPAPAYEPKPTYEPKPSYEPKPAYEYAPKPAYEAKPEYEAPKPTYYTTTPSYSPPMEYTPKPAYEAKPEYPAPKPTYYNPAPAYEAPKPAYDNPKPSYNPAPYGKKYY